MEIKKNMIKFTNGKIFPINHDGFLKWEVLHRSVNSTFVADDLEQALDVYDDLESKYLG